MKPRLLVILFLAGLTIGFFAGRAAMPKDEKVIWRQGETVVRAVPVPEVDWFEIPKVYFLPTKQDTVFMDSVQMIVQKVDTPRIIEEYVRVNRYNFNLFDDEHGKMDINQSLQYNRIMDIGYTFTPRYKEVSISRKPIFTPFAGITYNTGGVAGIGGGAFIGNIGIEYQYFSNNTHGVGIKYQFR